MASGPNSNLLLVPESKSERLKACSDFQMSSYGFAFLNGADIHTSADRYLFRMMSSGMLRHVALVRTDVSEELSASFIRVTRIVTRNNTHCNLQPAQRASVASCSEFCSYTLGISSQRASVASYSECCS
jgi:hypothetical protein